MKRSIKFLLVAVLALGSTTLFAQKFGRIDYSAIIPLMPEFATVEADFIKIQTEYQEGIEGLNVERNKLIDEFSKLPETATETQKQLKQRAIQDITVRIQDYQQVAQEALLKAQTDLTAPLHEKADAAIKKISKAQGIIVVFQIESVVYIDEDQTIDITGAVRKELGIADDAVAPTAPAAAQ